jgi:hypothetical protein
MAAHVVDRLAAWADREVDEAEWARIDTHLADCASCRDAWGRYQFASELLRQMTPSAAPAQIWTSIDAALDRASSPTTGLRTSWWMRPAHLAACAALVLAVGATWWWTAQTPEPWDVVRLDAGPRAPRVPVGEWIETGDAGTARLGIGEIGTVDLAPRSRLRLVKARPDEQRLDLAYGSISVEIVAPPRVFFVETPSSLVVDLGCAYTMDVDEGGYGRLRVTDGWAALEGNGRESLVPAGASAETRPALGPGTPSFDDASEQMRTALREFDYGPAKAAALDTVLADARERDTLTLWHLMWRVDPVDRLRVFDRIVELTPLPAGVERSRVLALEPDAMRVWREELAWTW